MLYGRTRTNFPMLKTIESAPGVGEQAGDALDALRKALVVIKLTAYAADAMRVLNVLQQHADHSQSFDQTVKSVCADWRNPGSLDNPADLIAEALVQVSVAILNCYPGIEHEPLWLVPVRGTVRWVHLHLLFSAPELGTPAGRTAGKF